MSSPQNLTLGENTQGELYRMFTVTKDKSDQRISVCSIWEKRRAKYTFHNTWITKKRKRKKKERRTKKKIFFIYLLFKAFQ